MSIRQERQVWQAGLIAAQKILEDAHKEMALELTEDLDADTFHELVYIRMLVDGTGNSLRQIIRMLDQLGSDANG